MKYVYIYTIASSDEPDNIRYVGKTVDINKRIKRHTGKYYLSQKDHKARWLSKIIADGHFPIIEAVDYVLESEWEFWEQYWISQFKSWNFNLTNLTAGGNGGFQKGHLNTFYGKKHSAEVLKIIQNSAPKKSVKMYDIKGELINTFISIREASKITGINHRHISGCCNNIPHYNTAGGFVFKFEHDEFKLKKVNYGEKPVAQYTKSGELIKIFESIIQASKETKANANSICSCAKGKSKTAGGYIFKYI